MSLEVSVGSDFQVSLEFCGKNWHVSFWNSILQVLCSSFLALSTPFPFIQLLSIFETLVDIFNLLLIPSSALCVGL